MNTASETMNRESFDAQLESLGLDERTIHRKIMRETIRGAFFLQEMLDLLSAREREELGISHLNLLEEFTRESLSVNHRKQREFLSALRRAHECELVTGERSERMRTLFASYCETLGRLNGMTSALAFTQELVMHESLDEFKESTHEH